jgi:hypothetical protein
MPELAIAVAVLGYSLLLVLPGIEWQARIGVCVTLLGLFGGGGAGLVYHLALRKALVRLGAPAQGWIWSPVARHPSLDEEARKQVLRWFHLGAAGFALCLAGMGLVAAAVVRATFAV